MGKMMPLKWIAQAETRRVCVNALSEAAPTLNSPVIATFLTGSLWRMRSWLVAAERDREADKPSLAQVVRQRRVRRAAS
jgi:hypothetical protein